jgi:23S rRNA G2445 N2-methylase RlmL
VLQYACCDVNNRGVAYADGNCCRPADGKLTVLDAASGKAWTTKVDYKQGSVITSPPLGSRQGHHRVWAAIWRAGRWP